MEWAAAAWWRRVRPPSPKQCQPRGTSCWPASNLLTYATGLYISLFIALPVTEWMYQRLTGNRQETQHEG
ncbi:MAG: DUF3100 domain-containing protein [Halomonas sp.]|nr:DUF3100 domain-containing protein [Halomonas sp.]MDM7481999.1 DUF3100 domain-containing protein [Halomonas sp.]